jgi:spore germination protein GerM
VVVLVAATAAGCGVAAEGEPEAVLSRPLATPASPRPHTTDIVEVYLVRDGHLVAVPRTGRSVVDAVTALLAGPTDLDAEAELESLLASLPVGLVSEDPDVVVIDVPHEFAALSARDRLLAAAQLVWTATDVCCATRVRILLDERPLPVPTDGGPVARPVGREDYQSVAPL